MNPFTEGTEARMRFFNTAGPIKPEIHYYLPPLERLNKPAGSLGWSTRWLMKPVGE